MQTQIAWVYAQLKKGRILTPLIAMDGCGTMRLAAIIHTLRQRGNNILTVQKETLHGHRYATYKMVKAK